MPTQPVSAHIAIENIVPNPYRTRQPNPARVMEIAYSIHRNGLIQPPTGRYIQSGKRIQLAAGNTRFEAWHMLANAYPLLLETYPDLRLTDPTQYTHMPVILRDMTDQELFEIMAIENHERDGLNPIELAAEMLVYRDQFGKSSDEIGKLYNLSGSAVRNLLRLLDLLDLPDAPRTALAEGTMSQAAARALLPLYAIPEETRKALREFHYAGQWECTHTDIIQAAVNGAQASTIEDMINHMLRSGARKLEGIRWELSDPFPITDGIIHPACLTCPKHIERQKTHWSAQSDCLTAKSRAWQRQQLISASHATGLPIHEHTGSPPADFDYSPRKEVLPNAQAIQCPNLCLRFSEHKYQRKNEGYEHCTIPGHPGAEIICAKMEQHCTCLQSHKAGIPILTEMPQGPVDPQTGVTNLSPTPAPVTPTDLKAINRQIKEQKKQAKEEVKAIREQATSRFYTALSTNHLPAWQKILNTIYGFNANTELTVEDLLLSVSAFMVEREFQYEKNPDDIPLNLRRLNRWLKEMHLDPLETSAPVSTETPPSPNS